MKLATPPTSEVQRLAALRDYKILDTPPDAVFDDLTALAALICKAPIALISMVDENRVWFKSQYGLSGMEIPRNNSFSALAIHHPDGFIVPDTLKDKRFTDNPLVIADPSIRFYAGMPLVTSDGHALGVLCVIDRVPRKLSARQRQALNVLIHCVMTQLELRRRSADLARIQKDQPRATAKRVPANERRQADEELKSTVSLLAATLESTADGILVVDADHKISRFNQRFVDMWRIPPEIIDSRDDNRALGFALDQLKAPKDFIAKVEELYAHPKAESFDVLQFKDGRTFERYSRPQFIGGHATGRVWSFRDITARKQADASTLEWKNRYEAAINASGQLVYDWNSITNAVSYGGNVERILGYSKEEMEKGGLAHWLERIHPDDRDEFKREIAHVIDTKMPFHQEYRIHRKDGTCLFVQDNGYFLPDASNNSTQMIGLVTDITEYKRAEAVLIDSERRLRFLKDFDDSIHPLVEPQEILATVSHLLGSHLRASRCAYAEIDADGDHFTIAYDYIDGCASIVGDYSLSLFGSRAVGELREGRALVINDMDADMPSGESNDMFNAIGTKAVVCCPIVRQGKLQAMMAVHQTTVREWTPGEITLVEEVARRCWGIVQRTRAEKVHKRVENELLLTKLAIDKSQIAFFRMGSRGQVAYVNDFACQHLGYTREELLGMSVWDFDPNFPREAWPALWVEMMKTRDIHIETLHQHKDGTIFPVEVFGNLLSSEEGDFGYVFVRDISKRKLQEEEIEQLSERVTLATTAASMGVWDWNVVDNVLLWDDSMYRLYGINKEGFGGVYEAWERAVAVADAERVASEIEAALKGEREYNSEFRVFWPDGSMHYVSAVARTFRDQEGRPTRMVGVNYDITERKLREMEIQQLNAELELRVQERTSRLEQANKELESFSYSVSHDLRAPLRSMDGFSHILLEDYSPQLDGEGKRMLTLICSEATRLGLLIDDLLEFSRMNRQEMIAQECDMTELAQNVYDGLDESLRGHVKKFKLKPLPPAEGDPVMLRQVLFNLLANAAKFTIHQPSAEIEVGAWSDNGMNTYYVKDNGAGFDQRYVHKLFSVFQRLHTETEFEGTGVGLASVQRVIMRHGGRVWAKGKPDEGATFYFALPVVKEGLDAIAQ